jgi:hypothetical protein
VIKNTGSRRPVTDYHSTNGTSYCLILYGY